MNFSGKIRIGSRGSPLAIAQAKIVEDILKNRGYNTEIIEIKSRGDQTDIPLRMSKEFGLFTKEINSALLEKRIDIAVHSMKDIPTNLEKGLEISAVVKRGPVEDFLVSKKGLFDLPEGSKIGTSSQRRREFLKFLRPDIEIVDIRGNLDTRIKKYKDGAFDGIIVARAGLVRLDVNIEGETLNRDLFLPQANQGAIAVVTRGDIFSKISSLVDDWETHIETFIEREALRKVGAGCHSTLGLYAKFYGDKIMFHASHIKDMKRFDFYRFVDAWNIDELLNDFMRWYNE
ncbi:MAG: hydroxymethylbilane synthase [Thermoplasmata archaeon]|nr:hydroxymethylbilane synthase [Euryarchaeota archaeon]MVT36242.1 hydroxymethylbilane synthase [Euryarchaeota archaeon]